MKIELINVASVTLSAIETKILTDPWYCEYPFQIMARACKVEKDIDINALRF